MRLLLDTHVLLWASLWPDKLSADARLILDDDDNELVFSAVNIWEIAIKRRLERPDFIVEATILRRALVDAGYIELSVTSDHAIATSALPPIHKDPFDRLLVAQATVEGLLLLTSDAIVCRYPGPIRRV